MQDKIIHLDDHFPTGELTVQPVLLWANGRPCYEGISKHASVGTEYFKTITPVPGHSFVYVLAMSAWETYGENRNGDAFPEHPYKEHEKPAWIAPTEVLTQHYQSFEQFGNCFRHHQNKDPEKAVGKILKSFWNPTMHRVELLIDLDDLKAPDLADRIKAGEYPPVSMGCRVPYDVCSICGNRAPTRAQYCDHAKFQMREVINGLKVCVLNPSPKLFDISWVFRPADPIAFMLKKVAHEHAYELSGGAAGEYLQDMAHTKSAARKLAVIDKVVQGLPVDVKQYGVNPAELQSLQSIRGTVSDIGKQMPPLPDSVLHQLSAFSLPRIFSTMMASGGMMLSTPEVIKITIIKAYPKTTVDPQLVDRGVALQNSILGLFSDYPQLLEKLRETGAVDMGVEHVDPKIAQIVAPYMEKRSGIGQYLKRQLIPEDWRDVEPMTQRLTVTDPASNTQYGTTISAATKAHDAVAKANLVKVLGGAALLGGAYKMIGTGLDAKGFGKMKPLAALGLGALGVSQWPTMGKHYMSDQGVPIPVMTELAKMSSDTASLAIPLLGTLGTMALMSHDYQSRLRSGIPLEYDGLPLSRQLLDRAETFADDHPLLTGLGGVVGLRQLGKTQAAQWLEDQARKAGPRLRETGTKFKNQLKDLVSSEKISMLVADAVTPATGTVIMPDIDLEKVSMYLGDLILNG